MTRSEFDATLQSIRRSSGSNRLRDQLLLLMTWNHALRISEAVMFVWEDVLFHDGKVYVRRVKGSRPCEQYLPGDELRMLRRMRAQQDSGSASRFVFVSRFGTPLTSVTARDIVMTAARSAGVPIINPHSLRHGRAVEAYHSQHLSVPEISALLGHRDLRTTTTYLAELGIVVPAAPESR